MSKLRIKRPLLAEFRDIRKSTKQEVKRMIPVTPLEFVERGAYCKILEQRLVVASCPLPTGHCMWKHRSHGLCTYGEDFAGSKFTPQEFALRVGLPPPTTDEVNNIHERIVAKVREALST